jgi:hypothetical protein
MQRRLADLVSHRRALPSRNLADGEANESGAKAQASPGHQGRPHGADKARTRYQGLQALVVRHTPDRDTEVARQIAKLQVAIATANKALKKQGAEP